MRSSLAARLFLLGLALPAAAQLPPYHQAPAVEPPYHRVRYPGSESLAYPANFTLWVPPGVATLRGVVVHQHGCGEGSCLSGQTGAFDLHWQALARRHDCALLSPSYEQPEKADCSRWCDPRQGSGAAFQRALTDLAAATGHPELATVPWALWGHSGGGHWVGAMTLLHPERVAAAWLRSGVPPLTSAPGKPAAHVIPEAARAVPIMLNLGNQEGFGVTEGRFAGVWPAHRAFHRALRAAGVRSAVSVDPLSGHDCGNQRYLAIPWFDACLRSRLPARPGEPLRALPEDGAHWVALPIPESPTPAPVPADAFSGDPAEAVWLPSAALARAWVEYQRDAAVRDTTPPPAPSQVRVEGATVTWTVEADLESGLGGILIERDGVVIARLPDKHRQARGRPLFQGLQYSDTPAAPLIPFRYTDPAPQPGVAHRYRVIALNTVGLRSP
jgi:poly(3-hydroxybutyrate) depolymerase